MIMQPIAILEIIYQIKEISESDCVAKNEY